MLRRWERDARHVERDIRHEASHVRKSIEKHPEIDKLLKPLMRPPMSGSKAGDLFRDILEDLAEHGVTPLDFLHELKKAGTKMAHHHVHELSSAGRFLRSLHARYSTLRSKQGFLAPLKNPNYIAYFDQIRSDTVQFVGKTDSDISYIVDYIPSQIEDHVISPLSNLAYRDAAIAYGKAEAASDRAQSYADAVANTARGDADRAGKLADRYEDRVVSKVLHDLHRFMSTLKHTTVGIGNSAGGNIVGGLATTMEFIASWSHPVPKKYWGGECSLAVSINAETDIVLEVNPNQTPYEFGGPYISVAVSGGGDLVPSAHVGVAASANVNFGLNRLHHECRKHKDRRHTPEQVAKMLTRAYQGFSIGEGVGADLGVPILSNISFAIGDGVVQPLPVVELARAVSHGPGWLPSRPPGPIGQLK